MMDKNLVILEKWRSPPKEIANKVNSNTYLFKVVLGKLYRRQGILALNFSTQYHYISKYEHTLIKMNTHMTVALFLSDTKWFFNVGKVCKTLCRESPNIYWMGFHPEARLFIIFRKLCFLWYVPSLLVTGRKIFFFNPALDLTFIK